MLLEKLTNENIVGFECALVFLDLLKVCKIHNIVCRHICILMRKNSWKKTFLLLTSYQKNHVCFMMILLKSNLFLIWRWEMNSSSFLTMFKFWNSCFFSQFLQLKCYTRFHFSITDRNFFFTLLLHIEMTYIHTSLNSKL